MSSDIVDDETVRSDENRAPRPKVLFVTRKWPPAVGGMEIYSAELASALDRHAKVDVIKLPGRADGHPPSIINLARFFFATCWKLIWLRHRYDAILIGDLVLSPLAIWLRVWGRKDGIFVAAHGRDIGYVSQQTLLAHIYRCYMKTIVMAQAPITSVIANSSATAERCRQAGFNRVEVVPLGVRATSTPKIFGNPDRYVLFVGRVIPMKGLGWFISQVLPSLPSDIRLRVVGTIWDKSEGAAIESCPRADFVGPLFGNELALERANAIAVIVPNIPYGGLEFEGFGLSALEAAAQGGIVVAADLHGLRDAIVDAKTGFLLPAENSYLWANKIREIAQWDKERRRRFISKSIDFVKSYYSWDRVSHDYINLFRKYRGLET